MRIIWSEWPKPSNSLWASLVLRDFGWLSRGPASCPTVQRNIWTSDLIGLNQHSPPWLMQSSPWESSYVPPWLLYSVHLLYIVSFCNDYYTFCSVSVSILRCSIPLFDHSCIWLLFNYFRYCSLFWYWNCISGFLVPKLVNITCILSQ